MEYERTDTHQFCDTELCMVLDRVTGMPERFGMANAIMSMDVALERVARRKGWEDRMIIVKMSCIAGFALT